MRLLVPDEMPISLVPELDTLRLDLALDEEIARSMLDEHLDAENADDFWRRLRPYDAMSEWHDRRD